MVFQDFLLDMLNQILETGFANEGQVSILCADTASNSCSPTIPTFKDTYINISLMHLSGGLSMINPYIYYIHTVHFMKKKMLYKT